jgi:hypothetical protein
MASIPTPLHWRRRAFAVLEPAGLDSQLYAFAVVGIVSGPFGIYRHPHGLSFCLVHLPTQAPILTSMRMQNTCRSAAEELAGLDLNWWTCDPAEVVGPDLQGMRNIVLKWKPRTWVERSAWVEGES